jgi:hypothetical protein
LFSIALHPSVVAIVPLLLVVQTSNAQPTVQPPDPFVEQTIAQTLWQH